MILSHQQSRASGSKRLPRPTTIQDILPLCFIGSWASFLFCIIIRDAIIQRHDSARACVLFAISGALFTLTILSLLTASTGSPGCPDPELTPDGVREAQERKIWEDDDIPLGRLRGGRRPDLKLATTRVQREADVEGSAEMSAVPSSVTSGQSPAVSPFPLAVSPFVPTTATDAGEDQEDEEQSDGDECSGPYKEEVIEEAAGDEVEQHLLAPVERREMLESRKSLFAKNSSGGHRWCSKCDAWKPDRCHHCRFCKRCTLKMDHHCIWIGTCVGYHNYKPFLLFVTYGTFLALSIFIGSGLSMIHYLTHPEDYTSNSPSGMEVSELTPVSFMLLTFIGAFFTMTIGGLAGYHWSLVFRNKTTLEDITHTYPSALLEDRPTTRGNQPGWRGDHLLSRSERMRLREEASALNVYDLGWRRNVREVLSGSSRPGLRGYFTLFWPTTVSRDRLDRTAGHYFEYDSAKLERLQDLTVELRIGRRGDDDDNDDE